MLSCSLKMRLTSIFNPLNLSTRLPSITRAGLTQSAERPAWRATLRFPRGSLLPRLLLACPTDFGPATPHNHINQFPEIHLIHLHPSASVSVAIPDWYNFPLQIPHRHVTVSFVCWNVSWFLKWKIQKPPTQFTVKRLISGIPVPQAPSSTPWRLPVLPGPSLPHTVKRERAFFLLIYKLQLPCNFTSFFSQRTSRLGFLFSN